MIGQKYLLETLKQQIEEDMFPQFTLFVGQKGSGRKTLMREVCHYLDGYTIHELADVKVDTIRDMIDEANKKASSGAKIAYIIPDSENMSLPAKNSILKIVEEPPKGAYFLMSVYSLEDTLDTIKNRAAVCYMRPYSEKEKLKYLDTLKTSISDSEINLILQVSNTLYDVEKLLKSSPGKLQDYATKLIDSFSKSNPSKLLSAIKDIAFKDDAEGYQLDLFWKMCCHVLADKAIEHKGKEGRLYAKLLKQTIEKMGEARQTGVSKEHTFDMWLLDCRKTVKKHGNT